MDRQENSSLQQPDVFRDESTSLESKYGRKRADLINAIYTDLLKSDKELSGLEHELRVLEDSRDESTSSFDIYNRYIQSYYTSAGNYAGSLRDTVLRDKLLTYVKENYAAYEASVSGHQRLAHTINKNQMIIEDLRKVIMITKTMPVMHRHQKDSYPDAGLSESYIRKQEKLINKEKQIAGF